MLGRFFAREQTVYVRRRLLSRLFLYAFGLVAIVCCGFAAWPILKDLLSGLADLVIFLFIIAVMLGAHALTSRWAYLTRQARAAWLITQGPYLVLYGMVAYWWWGDWPDTWLHAPSWWYVGWVAAALVALSWLLIWWRAGDRKAPKRAVALFSGIGVLVLGNAAGIGAVVWQNTEGFGLKGYPTPYHAWSAVYAASCIGDDLYSATSGTKKADCPRGADADEVSYDELLFSLATCNTSDVLKPFKRWHDIKRDAQTSGWWKWRKVSEQETGETATFTVVMETESFLPWRTAKTVELDKLSETWVITLDKTALDGWKVCGIEVKDPITVKQVTPKPAPSTSPGAPRVWDNRVRFECLPSAAQSPYRRTDCAPTPPDWTEPGPYQCAPDFPALFRAREWLTWCRGEGWDLPER